MQPTRRIGSPEKLCPHSMILLKRAWRVLLTRFFRHLKRSPPLVALGRHSITTPSRRRGTTTSLPVVIKRKCAIWCLKSWQPLDRRPPSDNRNPTRSSYSSNRNCSVASSKKCSADSISCHGEFATPNSPLGVKISAAENQTHVHQRCLARSLRSLVPRFLRLCAGKREVQLCRFQWAVSATIIGRS